jgi:hypothetical protein
MSKILKIIPKEKYSDDFFNIVPASEFVPEWYRKSPSSFEGSNTELDIASPSITTATYKKCTPFFDALTSGYMAYLTADIEVTDNPNNPNFPYILWRATRKIITEHSPNQWQGLVPPKGYYRHVLKWHNSLGLRTPEGYSLLFTHPSNRFDLPFITITGVVDTDRYEQPVQYPFFLREDFTGIIEAGTPIAQITPIKRDIWSREHFKYNEDEAIVESEKFRSTIKRAYKNLHWIRKEYK